MPHRTAADPIDSEASGLGGVVRADGRPAELVQFERAVVSFFGQAADLLGVPKSVAAIYGVCFASPVPVGFSELQSRLDISTGSISQGLRVLREIGALKVADPGAAVDPLSSGTEADQSINRPASVPLHESTDLLTRVARHPRAQRYTPDLELRKLVSRWLEERLQRQLDTGSAQLKTVLSAMPGGDNPMLQERVACLQNWHGQARALLPLIKTFLKLT